MEETMKARLMIVSAALLMLGVSAHAQTEENDTLQFVERAKSDAVLDLGDKGDSAGDVLTFANEVFDKANKTKLGTSNGYCVRTVPATAWQCFWTLTLKDGQIMTEGPFLDKGDSVLAVTGGTGEYSSARGEMKLHSRNDKGTEYDFVYTLELDDDEEGQQ
jgi:hypothetical protein